jgi:hypothetical protein
VGFAMWDMGCEIWERRCLIRRLRNYNLNIFNFSISSPAPLEKMQGEFTQYFT